MSAAYTIAELAKLIGGQVHGDGRATIRGVADIDVAGPSDATWVANEKYAKKLATTRAGAVLLAPGIAPPPTPAIICDKLEPALAALLKVFEPLRSTAAPGVHSSAFIHPSVTIGDKSSIGPHAVLDADVRIGARSVIHAGVFIGRGSKLGDDCLIWPNVVIRDGCTIGNRVIIHPNAVIGADGFGYRFENGRFEKYPHIGGVVLEDDVEIGACTCVDRAKVGLTIVGRGVKLDNLVQIGHNVHIGEHCVIAGCTGVGGSVRMGKYCMFGGGVMVADHVTIGDGVRFTMDAGVTKDIPAGMTVSGLPARDHREEMRGQAMLRRLPGLLAQIKELVARVERLEASEHHQP